MKNIDLVKGSLILFALNTTLVTAQDEGDIVGWQTPLAEEFSRIDQSGNGLLMPYEASKVFNKKSFAAADVDRDGTIDQAEYIRYQQEKSVADEP